INACTNQGSGQVSRPKDRVAFNLIVGPDGRVKKAQIEKGKEKYKDFEQCVVKWLKNLKFPMQTGGKDTLVTITFALI
ncbi:MAG: AgmX/PglI C-terminal domain-containing protein, partial [Desulfobacteraceae bacterium]